MNIGTAMITTGLIFLTIGFYNLMIKPKQEAKNASNMPILNTYNQDDDYCRIAAAISKSIDENEFKKCWDAIDQFYKKYKNAYDTEELLKMCEERELVVCA